MKIDLTKDELRLVEEFGQLLDERHNYRNVAQSDLIRYVIGCKHRIPVAERRFLNMKEMERQFNLNDIALYQVRDELSKRICVFFFSKNNKVL